MYCIFFGIRYPLFYMCIDLTYFTMQEYLSQGYLHYVKCEQFAACISCDWSSSSCRRYPLWLVVSKYLVHWCDLKAPQINVQCSLLLEIMLNEFKLDHNAMEATKNICFAKDDGATDYCMVTRWFKRFCSKYKNFDDQARIDRPCSRKKESQIIV